MVSNREAIDYISNAPVSPARDFSEDSFLSAVGALRLEYPKDASVVEWAEKAGQQVRLSES